MIAVDVTNFAQRSVVEVDIIEGWALDDDTAAEASEISRVYRDTGRLLVSGQSTAEGLLDIVNGFDASGETRLREAAEVLLRRVRDAIASVEVTR